MSVPLHRCYLDGDSVEEPDLQERKSSFEGHRVVSLVAAGGMAELDRALSAAVRARATGRELLSGKRRALCQSISEGIVRRSEEIAKVICEEAGKPIRLARIEVQRAAITFSLAAAEAIRAAGEFLHLDLDEATARYEGIVRRVPQGIVAAISPFNYAVVKGESSRTSIRSTSAVR